MHIDQITDYLFDLLTVEPLSMISPPATNSVSRWWKSLPHSSKKPKQTILTIEVSLNYWIRWTAQESKLTDSCIHIEWKNLEGGSKLRLDMSP